MEHQFSDLVEQIRRQGLEHPKENITGLHAITLSPTSTPESSFLPGKSRSASQVTAIIIDAFDALCAGTRPWPCFLHGPPGTGKTCAALCLLDRVVGKEKSYYTVRELCSTLIKADRGELFSSTGYEIHRSKILEKIQRAGFAVLDEIGMRSGVTDHHYEAVAEWLDGRGDKPSIVISNLGLDEIQRLYDDRIADRLSAGTVIAVSGESRRAKQ